MIWLCSGLIAFSIVLFILGVILAVRYENLVYFLLFVSGSYALLFLTYVSYVAWTTVFTPLTFVPVLVGFIIPPGIVFFFVGCCAETKEVRQVSFGAAILSAMVSFAFLTMWYSAMQVI